MIGSLERNLVDLQHAVHGPQGLQPQLTQVTTDLRDSHESLEEMKRALGVHGESLRLVQERLRLRAAKPKPERIRDEALLALEEEEAQTMLAMKNLEVQKQKLLTSYQKLMTSEAKLTPAQP